MLQSLKIENIAIIEHAELELNGGFNVLTGETGAGKSIIIDSINAVLGERTSRELIRTGTSSAKVTAVFTEVGYAVCDAIESIGLNPSEDGCLIIQRSISADGKNVCRINGEPVTVSMLRTVGRSLINIHGQHDSQALLNSENHFRYLDSLAGNSDLLSEYQRSYHNLLSLKRELKAISRDDAEKARRLDILDFQINELETAQIVPGEWDRLTAKKNVYVNGEKIVRFLTEAYIAINGTDEDSGAVQRTESAAMSLQKAANYYEAAETLSEKVLSLSYDLAEHSADISEMISNFDIDERELDEIESRLDLLYKLSGKYGSTEEEMLEFLENAKREARDIELSDERIAFLESEIVKAEKETSLLAEKLSESRKIAGENFSQAVCGELEFLDMPSVVFEIKYGKTDYSETGSDDIEFLISANIGETPKPLSKIASGGELSRIMLAIKNVLSDKDNVDTLIFDEIDTGVSGRAAQKVAMKLAEVSRGRQVICVTHLAQIAAQADYHFRISKSVEGDKTYTHVTALDYEGRKEELARIIGGLEITELQLKSAEEMLRNK
ncbi:MAG: DNA repair protein RecN [Clostridiales bacterium]|nr:DNA repair protein RecN [Clostridiales bacterium]